jgi:hypothetical protein
MVCAHGLMDEGKKGTTMNPLTQFKIFKKIPILPLLIPLALVAANKSG